MKEQSTIAIAVEDAKEPMKAEAQWDASSDDFLRNVVTMTGIREWDKVTAMLNVQFPDKAWTNLDCKTRWYSVLEPTMSKKAWNEKEELEMIVAHKMCLNKWSSVSALLGGRNNNTIKNRYYSIFRKVKNKVKRGETIFNSRIELLEIFYMMAQMELHLMQPFPPLPHKGKRGKDFIYTLLQNLRIEEVERFRDELARAMGKQETLTDLWEEMGTPLEKAKIALADRIDVLAGKKACVAFSRLLAPVEAKPSLSPELDSDQRKILLPRPDPNHPISPLDDEEKGFIQSQAFLSKGPVSSAFHDVVSSGTQISYQTPALTPAMQSFSTFNPGMVPLTFEDFAGYATLARNGLIPIQRISVMPPPAGTLQVIQTPGLTATMYSALPCQVMRQPIMVPQTQIVHPASSMGMYIAQQMSRY